MNKIKKEHREKIRKTLRKLLTIELRIKFFKNEFKKEEVKFLEHINCYVVTHSVTQRGIRTKG